MAAIDKTYVNKKQYLQVREWWIKTRKKQKREIGHEIWLYPFSVLEIYDTAENGYKLLETLPLSSNKDIEWFSDDDNDYRALWNTSTKVDVWLSLNCPFDFIQDTLKEQYGEDWFIFKHKDQIDFEPHVRIWAITQKSDNNDCCLYFFKDIKDADGKILENEYIKKAIVYGTTYIFERIELAKQAIKGDSDISNSHTGMEVFFEYYGCPIYYKGGKFFIKDTDVEVTDESEGYNKMSFSSNPFGYIQDSEFKLPNFKHSYNANECLKYDDEAIFMSHKNDCFDISQYQNNKEDKKEAINRWITFLPEYLGKMIKRRKFKRHEETSEI